MEWMLMPLKRYADFTGRSRRMEYWMFMLLNILVYLVLGALMFAGGFDLAAMSDPTAVPEEPGILFWIGAGLLGLWLLAVLVPGIAVTVRRLHDRDMSGWWYLGIIALSLLPLIGTVISLGFLVLMLLEGTKGPNRFGPDPKGGADASVFE
jgi:uncharacterized membrane protein YhaH (DUF805 family)